MAGRKQVPKTLDVFISYSHRDQAVADRVHRKLVERRLSCFYDARSLGVGEEWRSRLYRAIQSAKTVVLIISPSSLESKEVRRETNKALIFGAILCPIVIGSVDYDSELCLLVNEYHWLESDEPPSDEELDRLVERVAAIVGVDQKTPTVTLTSPAGATHCQPGETVRIAWEAQAAEGTSLQQISLELLSGGAAVYSFPGKHAPWAGSVRECDWTVPASLPPGRYTMRLVAINNLGHVGHADSAAPITIESAGIPAGAAKDVPRTIPAPRQERSLESAAAAPTLKILEPAAGARWTLGRLECLRLALTDAEELGLKVSLEVADGALLELVRLNPLELRGKLAQSAGQKSAVIPVMVPASLAIGAKTLRIKLTAADGKVAATSDIDIELAQPVARNLRRLEEDECVYAGLGFGGMTLAGALVIALFRQCMPVLRQFDLRSLNVGQIATQLGEAATAALWENLFLFPTVALFGTLMMIAGALVWLLDTRKSIGGSLIGSAWGAAIGLGLSLLAAEGPVAPAKFPSFSDLSRFGVLGQQDERVRLSPLLQPKDEPLDSAKNLLKPLPVDTLKSLNERLKELETATEKKPAAPPKSEPPALPSNQDLNISLPAPVEASAPTWHKQPVKGAWSWAFWGAVVGAVLGAVFPFVEQEK